VSVEALTSFRRAPEALGAVLDISIGYRPGETLAEAAAEVLCLKVFGGDPLVPGDGPVVVDYQHAGHVSLTSWLSSARFAMAL
jgi:hypothetical protein